MFIGTAGWSLPRAARARGRPVWCIFDNTTLGAATGNILHLAASLQGDAARIG